MLEPKSWLTGFWLASQFPQFPQFLSLSFLICKMGSNPKCTGLCERTHFREYLREVPPSDSMYIFKHLN